MKEKRVTRRSFLKASIVAVIGAAVQACAQPTPQVIEKEVPVEKVVKETVVVEKQVPVEKTVKETVVVEKEKVVEKVVTATPLPYKEAPMLAALVKAGKLPPVEERLPIDPRVIKPLNAVGKYGGTMRMGEVQNSMWSYHCFRFNGLLEYDQRGVEISVDIAKAFSISPDAKVITFELRKGHKWSDGEPFTTDDVMFWWNDVVMNQELSPAGAGVMYKPGGTPAKFTKIDDTKWSIEFAKPWPCLLDYWGRSGVSGERGVFLPKHTLSKWHKTYNPKVEDEAKAANLDNWTKLFNQKRSATANFWTDLPTLNAWKAMRVEGEHYYSERNPYYHAVDTAGNQLPYIDAIDAIFTGNKEVQTLKASSGEFDFECYYLDLKDMAVFRENQAKGKYRILLPLSLRTSDMAIMPSRHYVDEYIRGLLNNREFRLALSCGIDRQAINQAVYFGLAQPFQAIPIPFMPFFEEEWRTKYTAYEPDKANQILDKLGLDKKNADGYRLRADNGQPLELKIDIGVAEGPKSAIAELVCEQWKAIGLKSTFEYMEGNLFNQRVYANESMLPTWHLDRAGRFGRADPLFFGWNNPSQQRWGYQWARWYSSGGKEGEEPPQEIKDMMKVFEDFQATIWGSAEMIELGKKYYGWFLEELNMIGTVGFAPIPMIVTNRLKNVPEKDIYWTSDTNFYSPYQTQQFYIDEA